MRERQSEGHREREESLHFTEEAFVSSEYFTEMRENEKQGAEKFLSLMRLGMKEGEKGRKTEGEMRDERWPLLSYQVYFSHVYWLLITPTC